MTDTARLWAREAMMCGLRKVPFVGTAVEISEGVAARRVAIDTETRLGAVEAQMSRFQRTVRDLVRDTVDEAMAAFSRPQIDGDALDRVIREIRDMNDHDYHAALFDGLFRRSSHYAKLKEQPENYGFLLDDHSQFPKGMIPVFLDCDKTRLLALPPASVSLILSTAHDVESHVEAARDVWALPGADEANAAPQQPTFSRGIDTGLSVGPSGADYTSIQQAINAAPEGATIRIRPGTYREALNVSKPLTLLGDGAREQIIIETRGTHTLYWTAPRGRVAGLTLRQIGADSMGYGALSITSGAPVLEDLDLTSAAGTAVHIGGANTAPTLRRSRIHDSAEAGVHIYDQAQGLIEDNDITGNANSGVVIKTGATPTVRDNRIRGNKQSGVFVWENGRGEIVDNDITGNTLVGVSIKTGGDLTVRGNIISGNGYQAIWVRNNGRGTIIGNDLRGNTRGAFNIQSSAGTVTRRDNQE